MLRGKVLSLTACMRDEKLSKIQSFKLKLPETRKRRTNQTQNKQKGN